MVAYLTTIKGSFIYYVRININSSDDFEHVLNEWSLILSIKVT